MALNTGVLLKHGFLLNTISRNGHLWLAEPFRKTAKIALCGEMADEKDLGCVDIRVTELFGLQVLRKYVKKVGKNEMIKSNNGATLMYLSIPMLLSFFICLGVVVWILYNPPPLVKELSESILINFGKSNTLALEEQLKNAKDRIGDLQREIEKLKGEGLAHFTREQQILAKLSKVKEENEALSNKVVRIPELEQNLEICMKEKTGCQKSYSDSQERENNANQDLANCNANEKRMNGEIKELKNTESLLRKTLNAADESVDELENISKKCQKDLKSVSTEKKAIDEQLKKTNETLTGCQAESKLCQKSNKNLTSNLSTCQAKNKDLEQDKDTLNKDLSATKYTLGNCKNKNMDHEVRSLELLQEIEGLKKELKAC